MKTLDEAADILTVDPDSSGYSELLDEIKRNPKVIWLAMRMMADYYEGDATMPSTTIGAIAIGICIGMEMEKAI